MDTSAVDLTTEVVRTGRLTLRPYTEADVDVLHRACQDPDVQRWIASIPVPYTVDDARRFALEVAPAARRAGTGMMVAVEVAGQLVGSSGVDHLDGHPLGPEIGYWTAPWAQGHGYATEAAHALAEWALGLGAPRVHLVADVDNVASQAVAVRAGFVREGVLRRYLVERDGSRRDAVVFSRLPGD